MTRVGARRAWAALAAAVALLARAGAAWSGVLAEDALEGTSRELGVVLRSYGFLMGGDVLEPSTAAEDTSPLGLGTNDLRFYFVETRPRLKLVAHVPLTATISSASPGDLAIGQSGVPPRLLPLRASLADEESFQVVAEVDWLSLAWIVGPVTLTIGRQAVSLGRSVVWRPEDLLAPFALTEVDTEYKHGVDAARLDWSIGERTSLHLVASPGELDADDDVEASLAGSAGLVQLRAGGAAGELGVLAGYVRGDRVAGLDAVIDGGSFDAHGEATATLLGPDSLAAPGFASGDVLVKGVVGMTFHPASTITLGPEVLYNGFGAPDLADQPDLPASPRIALGEQTVLGRLHYAASGRWDPSSLWGLGGLAVFNTTDRSALLSLALRYSVAGNADAELGGYLPLGSPPDGATGLPRTEYGLYPAFVYVKLKAVL